MKTKLILILQMSITLLASVALVAAQAACDVDLSDVIEQVDGVCANMDDNQVCYGNFEVNAIAQDNVPVQQFESQGDLADVAFIRSLFLSGLDVETERWGIAQMRLVTPTTTGSQDINLLLFGDVEVENQTENTLILDVVVGQFAANIRNSPRANALILNSAPSGEILEAVGRLEDSSWVRVRLSDGAIGWVSSSLVTVVDDSQSLDDLAVQDSSTPYFGPMQAFSFTDSGEGQCGNITTDGLLIQTPEGSARVTLLINEVSIELLPGANGSTAIVTGNATDGMTVSVIDGEAVVESSGSSFYVGASEQTTIGLDSDLKPTGAPSLPITYDVETLSTVPTLSVLRDPTLPFISNTTNIGDTGGNPDGNANGNRNGQGNSQANGRGNGRGNGQANGNRNGGN